MRSDGPTRGCPGIACSALIEQNNLRNNSVCDGEYENQIANFGSGSMRLAEMRGTSSSQVTRRHKFTLELQHESNIAPFIDADRRFVCGLTQSALATNPVVDWNKIALTTALTTPGTQVYLTYVNLAMYNAVNAIDRRYRVIRPDLSRTS